MRPFMQRRIDALHAEIARLVAVEKAWLHKTHPEVNAFRQSIADCAIEVAAWPPEQKRRLDVLQPKEPGQPEQKP